jgi:hypothetical protein
VGRIAAFLRIEDCPSLLHPTVMGQPWSGNSTSRGGFRGISQDALERWQDSVNHLEEWVVEATAGPVLQAFDYARRTPSRPRWVPVRGEWPRAYVRNRSLLADLKG